MAAGDGRASRAVYGQNKAYLEIAGRSLVARIVATLQRVPEVSEVWVVGRSEQLVQVLGDESFRGELRKPLIIVPQFRNLLENTWETFRRLLPGAGPQGRDPTPEEEEFRVLYLSSDLPFATPQEISQFLQRSLEIDCDYALGLVTEQAMTPFYPVAAGEPGIDPVAEPGIEMAYFNLHEGRFRQSNLHLVKPARLGSRQRIQDMYQHRYQKEMRHALSLAWKILTGEGGGVFIIWYFLLMHLAGVADRRGWRRLADWLRAPVTLGTAEAACCKLLRTRFRFVTTEVGGCAVDIDNEQDFETAVSRYHEWHVAQAKLAEAMHGPLPLPAQIPQTGTGGIGIRILPERRAPLAVTEGRE